MSRAKPRSDRTAPVRVAQTDIPALLQLDEVGAQRRCQLVDSNQKSLCPHAAQEGFQLPVSRVIIRHRLVSSRCYQKEVVLNME